MAVDTAAGRVSAPVPAAGWRVALEVPAAAVGAFAAALQSHCAAVSWFGEDQGPWQIEGYASEQPDQTALAVALALAAAASNTDPPELQIERLPPTDWVQANLDDFPALTIGRFFVHGSHDPGRLSGAVSGSLAGSLSGSFRGGRIGLRVDAATAFGSGRHASTAGCLEALGLLAHRPIVRPLDMGCGSGILAIAAARLWQVPVVAADIDPEAVRVTRRNARRNGVARLVSALCADSYAAPAIASRAPYDLIACNILARPLRRMARDLARCLAPGGAAVLSGFLAADANAVLAAHRLQGLRLIRRITIDGWQTLIVGRRQGSSTVRVRHPISAPFPAPDRQGRLRETIARSGGMPHPIKIIQPKRQRPPKILRRGSDPCLSTGRSSASSKGVAA